MIELRPRTLMEQLARLWPPYRRQSDQSLRDAIRRLVDDPTAPCVIDGRLIIPTSREDQTAQVADSA
jgi:hypothetical protein